MSSDCFIESLDPEEAFAVLADDTRIKIIQALWEADEQRASFSELRNAVGMRDSGKFNYHLGKLTDRFVRKTNDGYELRTAGNLVIGAILAGGYTVSGSIEPISLDDPCPQCSNHLLFKYEDERVVVDCEKCFFATMFPVPPGAFIGHEIDAFPDISGEYVRSKVSKLLAGFCSLCDGSTEISITALADYSNDIEQDALVEYPIVLFECTRCNSTHQLGLNSVLIDHPAVISFFHEHDMDIRRIPLWRLDAIVLGDRDEAYQVHEDPTRGTVTFSIDGDHLRVTVDESLEVTELKRSVTD